MAKIWMIVNTCWLGCNLDKKMRVDGIRFQMTEIQKSRKEDHHSLGLQLTPVFGLICCALRSQYAAMKIKAVSTGEDEPEGESE